MEAFSDCEKNGCFAAALGLWLFASSHSFAVDHRAAASDGCAKPGYASGVREVEHDGKRRTYRLHVPDGWQDTPLPLLVLFHGWGGNENEFLSNDVVTSLADERGYILAAPRGLGSGEPDKTFNAWSFSGSTSGLDGDGTNPEISGDTDAICDAAVTPDYSYESCSKVKANSCSWTHCQADDVEFALALIDELETNLCVESANVFAVGGSNGGMFTWELGQNARSAGAFRAIAPVIGLPHRGFLGGPGKAGPLPVLLITGTKDRTVPPGKWNNQSFTITSNESDRYYYTGATAITKSWAKAHRCDVAEAAAPFDAGYGIDCRTFCRGETGWPPVLDCRADMGHTYELDWAWPLVLDFFDAHRVKN